nr:hypothetical protein [Rhodococcus sp. 15-649-1-2]
MQWQAPSVHHFDGESQRRPRIRILRPPDGVHHRSRSRPADHSAGGHDTGESRDLRPRALQKEHHDVPRQRTDRSAKSEDRDDKRYDLHGQTTYLAVIA